MAKVQTYPELPSVVELILEVKATLVIMMRKCPMGHQTFVVIDVTKSFSMNKPQKEADLGP